MKLIAFKLVISAFQSWLLKGQQNRSKMPINIFAKQIMFPAYETNFSTSFFIPANKLKIQHLFIWHLILNSCRTACIGSIQDIWRIWAFNTFLFCIWFWTAAELLVLALYRTFDAYEPGQYVTGSVAISCKSFSYPTQRSRVRHTQGDQFWPAVRQFPA